MFYLVVMEVMTLSGHLSNINEIPRLKPSILRILQGILIGIGICSIIIRPEKMALRLIDRFKNSTAACSEKNLKLRNTLQNVIFATLQIGLVFTLQLL